MFDIGFPELVLIAVVGLLVIGPERLPEALRTLGLWLGRMRRSFANVKSEIEKEIGMDEVRRQLHNESVMEEMKRIEKEVNDTANETKDMFNSIQGEPSHPFDPRDAESETSSPEPASDSSPPAEPTPAVEISNDATDQSSPVEPISADQEQNQADASNEPDAEPTPQNKANG